MSITPPARIQNQLSKTKARAKTVPWNTELISSDARAADALVCTCTW